MKLSILAEKLQGELEGPDGETEIRGISTIQDAAPDQVCYFGNESYRKYLGTTHALAVICGRQVETSARNLILVANPYMAFREALILFRKVSHSGFTGIHPAAVIHDGAEIRENVSVGPNASVDSGARIGNGTTICAGASVGPGTIIGDNCLINANVSIYHDCVLGNRVIVHSGAVIGSDGFGFVPDRNGHLKVPQNGNVVIEDDVEIGSCCTIDRAVVGSTRIGRFAKLDNLVHVAHNVVIGPGCMLAAQTGIAGSTVVGAGVYFGGQAGIAGHISIGDESVIAAQAGVTKCVPPGVTVSGYPARVHAHSLRVSAALEDLPEFRRKVMEFMRKNKTYEEGGK